MMLYAFPPKIQIIVKWTYNLLYYFSYFFHLFVALQKICENTPDQRVNPYNKGIHETRLTKNYTIRRCSIVLDFYSFSNENTGSRNGMGLHPAGCLPT